MCRYTVSELQKGQFGLEGCECVSELRILTSQGNKALQNICSVGSVAAEPPA